MGYEGTQLTEDSAMTLTFEEYKAEKTAEAEKLTAADVKQMGKESLLHNATALMQALFVKLRDEYTNWESRLLTASKSTFLLREFFCDALEALRNASPVRLVRS